jgi:hypothetical protein
MGGLLKTSRLWHLKYIEEAFRTGGFNVISRTLAASPNYTIALTKACGNLLSQKLCVRFPTSASI